MVVVLCYFNLTIIDKNQRESRLCSHASFLANYSSLFQVLLESKKNMAAVGEALLSASVELLFDKISSEISDFFRSKKLDVSLLEKLKCFLFKLIIIFKLGFFCVKLEV